MSTIHVPEAEAVRRIQDLLPTCQNDRPRVAANKAACSCYTACTNVSLIPAPTILSEAHGQEWEHLHLPTLQLSSELAVSAQPPRLWPDASNTSWLDWPYQGNVVALQSSSSSSTDTTRHRPNIDTTSRNMSRPSQQGQFDTLKQELTHGSPVKGDAAADVVKTATVGAGAGSDVSGLGNAIGAAVTAGVGAVDIKANHDVSPPSM